MNKLLILFALIISLSSISSCTDDFDDLNTDPSVISEPNISYLLTNAMSNVSKDEYYRYHGTFSQRIFPTMGYLTQSKKGNAYDMNKNFACETRYPAGVISDAVDIQHRIDKLNEEKKQYYLGIKGITYLLKIMPSMIHMEDRSELKYTKAGLAPFTNPPLLKVPYDSEEVLINTWLKEIDTALELLDNENLMPLGKQDIYYNGDYKKWAKLANSLKLKIAALLVNKDRSRALTIAADVVKSKYGYIDDINEDCFYRLPDPDVGNPDGWGMGPGSKMFVSFLRKYKDPRLFLYFTKNDFNPEIIQAFIDNKVTLPNFLMTDINLDDQGNFESYGNEGEPWVRYHGMPMNSSVDFKSLPENKCYFDHVVTNRLNIDGKHKSYYGVSRPQNRLWQPNIRYYYPTLPGETKELERTTNFDVQLLMSAAETNMYLAEFKYLGAGLPLNADKYLKKGVQCAFDRLYLLAERNNLPWIKGDPYYKNDEKTNLEKNQELINAYLSSELFDLSKDGLEKIYLQQFIDKYYRLDGQWNLFKRTGIPKVNSKYLPWEPLSGDINQLMPIARRPYVEKPSETNPNYENRMESLNRMGFTLGTIDPKIMAKERHWWDKENPAFHAGPIK